MEATLDTRPEETHRWRSPALGTRRTLDLRHGPLDCFERGDGPPIVFAHGWLANANLWRHVVDALAGRFRCLALDLPLGAHRVPMRDDADLTPPGCGRLIADALDALDVDGVTLVGNDSGGAYAQIAVAQRPERIARLVLNACETPFDAFPPEPFTLLPRAAQDPATLRATLSPLEDPAVRMAPAAFGLLLQRPIDAVVFDSYVLPCLRDDAVLRDASRVMRAADAAFVRDAARRLIDTFERPVLLAWPREDRVFPLAHAERYAAELHDAVVVPIDEGLSFTPEDQPRALAEAIAAFAAAG